MNKEEIKLGIIGLGRIGGIHFDNLMMQPSGSVVMAVSDLDAKNRQMAHERGVEHVFEYGEELLNLDILEAVVICSPTNTHYEFIIMACNKGLHIFCEKPLDTDIGRIIELEKAVSTAGVRLQVGFHRRFDPNFDSIWSRIAAGDIGEPHLMNITSRDPAPPSIEFIKTSGGIFMDMTIHDFDMARFLMGCEVEEVFAWGAVRVDERIGEVGDIDTAIVSLRFENGALVQIDNSRKAVYGYDQRVEVFGPKGMIQNFNNRPDNQIFHDCKGSHASPPYHFFLQRYVDAYKNELVAFIECLAKNKPAPVGIKDSYMATAMALAAGRSYREGRVVRMSEILGPS